MAIDNLVQTFEYEGAPGHVSLDTQASRTSRGGRSRMTSHSVFLSVADRDAMVEAGMGSGVEEGYNRLDELLPTLQPVGAALHPLAARILARSAPRPTSSGGAHPIPALPARRRQAVDSCECDRVLAHGRLLEPGPRARAAS